MPAKGSLNHTEHDSRRRILWLPAIYILISGAILGVMLLQLRSEAIASGERLLRSFAQLAEEQTSRTVNTADETIRIVEARLGELRSLDTVSMNAWLGGQVGARPFVASIWVLDAEGQVLYAAGDNDGAAVADRRYFQPYRERPETGFAVWPPVRNAVTGRWLIPTARAWRHADATFAGVIVVALEPRYFDRVWTVGSTDEDLTISLFSDKGVMLMRSPLLDSMMGRSFTDGPLFRELVPVSPIGTRQVAGRLDNRPRLLSYRTLNTYPDLLVAVSQPVDRILAGWWHTLLIVIAGWIIASAALGATTAWLMREWARRRQTEERYRLLFDANPHPMGVHDPATLRFLAVNDAAIRQYGWSREELLGMTLADIRPPEDLPRLRAAIESPQKGYRMRHWRKDGTTFEVESIVQPIVFDGRPASLSLAQDVTEQNLTRSRLADAIQAFPGSFRLFDRDERLVLSNDVRWDSNQIALPAPAPGETFEAMVRRAANEELDVTAIGRKEDWLRDRLAQFRRGDTDVEVQWRDGRWFQLLERRTSDGGTISLRLDITARKGVEDQLRQSQKMEAVGQLTGGVAHDLNNMLTIIIGNAEVLLDHTALDAEARETLELMLRAAEGSAELTNRLLAFARRQPLQPKRVDVNEFVGRIDALLRPSLGEQIEIALIPSPDLWPVIIDPAQLEAAILNLALNARDAMPGGGRLTIGTGNAVVDATYAATHREVSIGDYVVVSISDTGTGMSPQTITRAFEPFFTTKDIGKGTGLGLSMVYGFTQQSGGHVTIYSEIGVGTTVRMYLPRAISVGNPTESAEDRAPISPASGEAILLVEDDDRVRGHVAAQLAQLGYRVIPASDGRQAIGILAGDRTIDLLFTDMVMPGGIGGRELAEQARLLRPGIRTLFTTGYSADAVVRAGRVEFDTPLLSKPYRLRELAERIRRTLDAD